MGGVVGIACNVTGEDDKTIYITDSLVGRVGHPYVWAGVPKGGGAVRYTATVTVATGTPSPGLKSQIAHQNQWGSREPTGQLHGFFFCTTKLRY